MRKFALLVLVFVLNLNMEVTPAPGPQSVRPQAAGPAAVNKTVHLRCVSRPTAFWDDCPVNGSGQCVILQLGNACWSFLTPSSVTFVLTSSTASSVGDR